MSSLSGPAGRTSAATPGSGTGKHQPPVDDGVLVQRVAHGDEQAATALVMRYQSQVRSFLLRVTGRHDLADDLAQETFLRMLRYADRYDARYPMKTWLFTIARRLSINHARDHRSAVWTERYEGMPAAGHGPAELAARADQAQVTRRLLDQAMLSLSAPQCQIVTLFYEHEQSIEQIAHTMDMPQGTVKSHLHRARASLRELLAPQLDALGA